MVYWAQPRRPALAMPIRPLIATLALVCALIAVPTAAAAPGEVAVALRGQDPMAPRVIRTTDVAATLARLRARGDVRYAVPNVVAHAVGTPATEFIPNDPGRTGKPGGWRATQWYLDGPFSINAPAGWENLIRAGAPGARGVKVAILDSGVAYRPAPPRAASPDLPRSRFLAGYDFVANDRIPTDEYGHGTQVASILGAQTNNGIALAGIAYNVRMLPVRVLDRFGNGDATAIARGVRFAVQRGVKVINLSLEFPPEYTARDIPQLLAAFRYARRKGVLIVVAAGNSGIERIPYPGRSREVLAVGASTEHGCVADYSNTGSALGLVAPGGGSDGDYPDQGCDPTGPSGRGIVQMTLLGPRHTRLDLGSHIGTSMAAPMVSAAAAAVVASGVIGRNPSPAAITRRLERTARDLGPPGYDTRYGWGLLDLAAATAPKQPVPPPPVPEPVPEPAPATVQ